MKKRFLRSLPGFLIGCFLAILSAGGQGYYENAIRYGQNAPFGSAKAMGMGGVQMAVGGDASAMATNPAAPGLLRKSEMQISLMPALTATSNDFINATVDAAKFRAPIGSFTLAVNNLKDEIEAGTFRGGTFTLSYNRTAVFDRKTNWEGVHKLSNTPGDTNANSLIDYYLSNVNTPGLYPKDVLGVGSFGGGVDDIVMAYRAYLLDVSNGEFISFVPRGDVLKQGYWDQSLSQGIWNAGYSANINNRLFLGASLGYYTCDYKAEVQYGERLNNVVVNPNNQYFNYLQGFKGFNYQITKNQTQTAKAITGSLGMIYKFSDAFRWGASLQLPSYTWMNETYEARFSADFNNIPYWFNNGTGDYTLTNDLTDTTSSINEFSWRMQIPAKYRLGFTYVAGKSGMVGLDLEYTDLSAARLSEGDGGYNFSTENAIIKRIYQPTLNVKVGGEIRLEDFRLRLGYAYVPTALKDNSEAARYSNNIHSDAHYITGGFGGRYEGWFWDAALVMGFWNTKYRYYSGQVASMPEVQSAVQTTQLRMGIGFYF